MESDGQPLATPIEAAVLLRLGLIRTDDLPDLAARWLARDLVDTPAARMLAGHHRHDPRALEGLLAEALAEAQAEAPREPSSIAAIAIDYVTAHWRSDGDTRRAVSTLAWLGEADPAFDLGLFVGLHDEWNAGWGRQAADVEAEARTEIDVLLRAAE